MVVVGRVVVVLDESVMVVVLLVAVPLVKVPFMESVGAGLAVIVFVAISLGFKHRPIVFPPGMTQLNPFGHDF